MRKLFTFVLLVIAANILANDTIQINIDKLDKFFVINDTVNNKVNIKYIALYDNTIYFSNKSTFDYWKICKMFDVSPVLYEIKSKKKIVK